MMPPETCPNCGAEVPRNAKACPECGSDEQTGWSEETHVDGLDLPEEKFDYDNFVEREFGGYLGCFPFTLVTRVEILPPEGRSSNNQSAVG